MRLLLAAVLPLIFWSQGIDTASKLKQAGIEQVSVPPDKADEWRKAGFKVLAMSSAELERREKLFVPRIAGRAGAASPTRRPWIDANGWRFLRNPAGKFYYDLPPGKAAIAIAESFVYSADAIIKIDPGDLEESGKMLAFLKQLPQKELSPVADVVVVDDGSQSTGEILNLLSRRNLLFKVASEPSPEYRVNIKLGTKEYTAEEAADPSAFAQKIRQQVGDDNRNVRVYGTEVVICRLASDGSRARLHMLNYSGNELDWPRVRLRGSYTKGEVRAFGFSNASLEDIVAADGATEFSIPKTGVYAVVDLH